MDAFSKIDGRYFLLNVPAADDGELKGILAKSLRKSVDIGEIHWIMPAVDEKGGIVRLDLDDDVGQLLKNRSEKLILHGHELVFVDRVQMARTVTSTIDDDVLQLLIEELPKHGHDLEALVEDLQLNMTKFQHDGGYECWLIEGSLANIKKFKDRAQAVLFKGVHETRVPSPNLNAKRSKPKHKRRMIRPVDLHSSEEDEETWRSGDDEILEAMMESTIEKIQTSNQKKPADARSDVCMICRQSLRNGGVIKTLKCGHEFHDQCISTWHLRKKNCPICFEIGRQTNTPPLY